MVVVKPKVRSSETISGVSLGDEPGGSRSRLTTRCQPDFFLTVSNMNFDLTLAETFNSFVG
jgi:hypothetical protein